MAPIQKRRSVLLLAALSWAMTCVIFPDINWGPVAFVCLTPWLVAVCTAERSRFLYLVSFAFGFAFFAVNIRWVVHVTREGYLALCLMYGTLFALAAWPIRHACRRRGWPACLVAPVVWTALEYARSTVPFGGFPWLLIGHSQYQFLTFIQIADVLGAYGVSFVVVMVNGWLADLLVKPIYYLQRERTTRLPAGSIATLGAVAATFIYGLAQSSSRDLTSGPRVAVIQHDFLQIVNPRPGQRFDPDDVFASHLELARKAAAHDPRPELIVLPEAIISYCFANPGFLDAAREELDDMQKLRYGKRAQPGYFAWCQQDARDMVARLQALCDDSGIPMIVGLPALEYRPLEPTPRVDAYNSTYLFLPGAGRPAARYDKQHLVLFGEYVPFRYTHPAIYDLLNGLTPFGREGLHYSLSAGSGYRVFEFPAASGPGRAYRAGTPICYEEIMPYVPRAFVRGDTSVGERKNIDMLITVSNDGWFYYSSELEQHLSAAVFRAIENRIAVARSVNTGGSGVIQPNGKVHSRVRMSDAQIGLLDAVEAALEKLARLVQKLPTIPRQEAALKAAREELGVVIEKEYQPALETLGPEFAHRARRLSAPRGNLTANNRLLAESIEAIRFLVDEDLQIVRRWRSRPHTAPGYVVDTIKLDHRRTAYTRWGDWFAISTVGLTALLVVDWSVARVRRSRGPRKAKEGRRT